MAEMDNSITVDSSCIPTVNERLGHLRPSRELLEFYRRKIAEFDGEYESLLKRLHKYKCTYEEQVMSNEKYSVLMLFLYSIKASGRLGREKTKYQNCKRH